MHSHFRESRGTGKLRSVWLALAAVVVYIALAAGLGNLLSGLVRDYQTTAQFALGHFIPLVIDDGYSGAVAGLSHRVAPEEIAHA